MLVTLKSLHTFFGTHFFLWQSVPKINRLLFAPEKLLLFFVCISEFVAFKKPRTLFMLLLKRPQHRVQRMNILNSVKNKWCSNILMDLKIPQKNVACETGLKRLPVFAIPGQYIWIMLMQLRVAQTMARRVRIDWCCAVKKNIPKLKSLHFVQEKRWNQLD